jgi:hypothetical protein
MEERRERLRRRYKRKEVGSCRGMRKGRKWRDGFETR